MARDYKFADETSVIRQSVLRKREKKNRPKVFISYVHENAEQVAYLRKELETQGIEVWQDIDGILPGERWQDKIRAAIQKGDFFLACFSKESFERKKTYLFSEILIAIEEMRKLPRDRVWFLPVLLSKTSIPGVDIGGGATLQDIQWVSLYDDWEHGIRSLVKIIHTMIPLKEEEISLKEKFIEEIEEEVEPAIGERFERVKKSVDDPVKIFISYSHHDSKFLTDAHFRPFIRILEIRNVEFWEYADSEIGQKWDAEVKSKIATCDIALLLISQQFLASDYIRKEEVQTFLELQETKDLRIFPIMLSSCGYWHYPWLKLRTYLPQGKNIESDYSLRGKRLKLYTQIFENRLSTIIQKIKEERRANI